MQCFHVKIVNYKKYPKPTKILLIVWHDVYCDDSVLTSQPEEWKKLSENIEYWMCCYHSVIKLYLRNKTMLIQ
jgi:selenophosphate synthetase-related protein